MGRSPSTSLHLLLGVTMNSSVKREAPEARLTLMQRLCWGGNSSLHTNSFNPVKDSIPLSSLGLHHNIRTPIITRALEGRGQILIIEYKY